MQTAQRRVLKIGGSLLTHPLLVDDLKRWSARQTAAVNLVVVGGGRLVDEIAQRQQSQPELDDVAAHWLCIRVMQTNSASLVRLVPQAELLTDLAGLADLAPGPTLRFIDPWSFMQADAHGTDSLPASWAVTSDSIAARLAERIDAQELVLLKSALPARLDTLGDFVDAYFAEAAKNVGAIRCVNLRDREFAEMKLR